jgi:hypothetical protein
MASLLLTEDFYGVLKNFVVSVLFAEEFYGVSFPAGKFVVYTLKQRQRRKMKG